MINILAYIRIRYERGDGSLSMWEGLEARSAFNAFHVGSGERSVSLVGDIRKLRAELNDTGLLLSS